MLMIFHGLEATLLAKSGEQGVSHNTHHQEIERFPQYQVIIEILHQFVIDFLHSKTKPKTKPP